MNEEGKKFMQRMFQLSLKDGHSVVAQKFNEEGFRNSDGRPYDGTTIGNYLRDKKVNGWWWPTRQIKDPKTGGRKNGQVGDGDSGISATRAAASSSRSASCGASVLRLVALAKLNSSQGLRSNFFSEST